MKQYITQYTKPITYHILTWSYYKESTEIACVIPTFKSEDIQLIQFVCVSQYATVYLILTIYFIYDNKFGFRK